MIVFAVGDRVCAVDKTTRTGTVSRVKPNVIRVTLDVPERWGDVTSTWVESSPRLWKSIL